MTTEKFISEIETLKKFFQTYCDGKKHNHSLKKKHLEFNNINYNYEFNLCNDCFKLLEYSITKLEACPHDIKPRCRTCPNPCYEPKQWKQVAKIMRYSGIKFGLTKIKKLFIKDNQ